MNERIYELAKQAGYNVKTYWTSADNYKTLAQTEQYMKDEVLEKLAVLIALECTDLLIEVLPPIVPESRDGIHPVWHIKQHFGVE